MNSRKNWTYVDYQTNDPQALENFKIIDPAEYQRLYDGKIDTEIRKDALEENWTYVDWMENDPIGLQNLEKNHREKFFQLYNDAVQKGLLT